MFAKIEAWGHALRRRLSRSEWAIRHLGLTPSEGTAEEPGLLLIQIDGLARTQLERAIKSGHLPFLAKLLSRENYELRSIYPGIPTTTPAVQAELFYGIHTAVPAFGFYRRGKKQRGVMYDSEWAKEYESKFQSQADGLLKGGCSWSNIYTGGATQEESHFCAASIGFGDMWRSGKIRNIFLFMLGQFPATLRIARQLIAEAFVAVCDLVAGVRHGEPFGLELGMAISRVFIGTGLRELITIGGAIDLARGLPAISINFISYDEHAHRRGPGSKFAHWSLRDIDRAIKRLFHAAQRSRRRDYNVWIFSDHGQEHTRSFAFEKGSIEQVIQQCLDSSAPKSTSRQLHPQRRVPPSWVSQTQRARQKRAREVSDETLGSDNDQDFIVTAIGPLGHLYFRERPDFIWSCELARRLVRDGGVPGVVVRDAQQGTRWFHREGETAVPQGVASVIPHPEPVRSQLGKDLEALCAHEDAGDLVLLGWSPGSAAWSFAPERGAHGGIGPEETRGFALLPRSTNLPSAAAEVVRPSELRAAAMHFLGRQVLPSRTRGWSGPRFRLVTYNTHGCSGTDGRISPRRIAHVLAELSPDIVALQELDLGRRRSRSEDQASLIAKELGLNVVFCPTVTLGDEHYGHALLSRWPIETMHRAFLPSDPKSWWKEPRSALWARVLVGERPVNVITTHLGLGWHERVLQIEELLGPQWIGGIPSEEPVIFCGDLNLTPSSQGYHRAARVLRDAQLECAGHRPINTFTSARPFTRLDHVFVSKSLEVSNVSVPRHHLSRFASDHLPLVVDLQVARAAAGMSTHTSLLSPSHTGRTG
ncbi:MAG: endonuclease/exonuclease/phosphatase family protein [Nibricoccus sp.]